MEEEKSSFQVALIKTSPPERHNAATPPLPHLTPAVQMTSKRFYVSARLQDIILLAFCRPHPPAPGGLRRLQHVSGQLLIPDRVSARTRSGDERRQRPVGLETTTKKHRT